MFTISLPVVACVAAAAERTHYARPPTQSARRSASSCGVSRQSAASAGRPGAPSPLARWPRRPAPAYGAQCPAIVFQPPRLPLRRLGAGPDDDDDFSTRWQMIKRRFTRLWLPNVNRDIPISASRIKRGEAGVWQRRFWEHLIKDQDDFARHLDYIHYNPVKHGLVGCPHQWGHSSFHRWVKDEIYRNDWMCQCGENKKTLDFNDITNSVGE